MAHLMNIITMSDASYWKKRKIRRQKKIKKKKLIIALSFIMLIFLCYYLFFSCNTKAYSEVTYGSVAIFGINSIYDGDTFKCDIQGWPAIIGRNISIRIYGIDCPEIRTSDPVEKEKAIEARMFALIRLTKAVKIELKDMRRDKYFRILAVVMVDGKSLGDMLLDAGLAKIYGTDVNHPYF